MAVVGIDLGTTASVVAIKTDDEIKTIEIDGGHNSVPSVVNYDDEQNPIVGRGAFLRDSQKTAIAIKRKMGTDEKFCEKTPAEISAGILSYIKKSAEKKIQEEIDAAVITVPAHFSELQRIATKQAASLAGIKILRLINEPTAAAIAFGINQNGVFAVYDLGGGTFDFSVLRVVDGIFQVLATGGDNYLGGNDIDEYIFNENVKRYNINPSQHEKNRGMLLAKQLKESIKDQECIEGRFLHSEKLYDFSLNQNLLKCATDSVLQKTQKIVDQVLEDAHVDLDGVVLVGGMTKLSLVKNFVRNLFADKKVFDDINPDEAVALGAAIEAHTITHENDNLLLIDVVPLTLGIETYGGSVDKIIHRNTPIPISEKRQYTTYQSNQTGMKFRVVQGERPIAQECRSLATFELKGIPPMPAGVANVIVEFSVDVNGLLQVSAREQSTGIEQKIVVEPAAGLSDDDMISMLESAFKNKKEDSEHAKNIELVVDANRSISFWNAIINEIPKGDSDLAKRMIRELEKCIEEKQYKKIIVVSDEIDKVVGKYVDTIISNHLCGKKIIER